jgi:hypothetical protein
MTMQQIVSLHPEWSLRVKVEAWLTGLAREAGEYAETALADFGARLDTSGEADVSHLPDADVEAIFAAANA